MTASDDLRRADAVAAGLNRGLNVEPMRWSELLAIAQEELGNFQQRSFLARASDLYDEELATPLIAAARIIQEVALRSAASADPEGLGDDAPTEAEDSDERHLLLILSSCTFGMYGNFPSAAAIQRHIDPKRVTTEAQWLALTISNPRRLGDALRTSRISENGREFLESFNKYLHTGDESQPDRLIRDLEDLLKIPRSISDVTFLRCARLALKHATSLAMSKLYRLNRGAIFNGLVANIIDDGKHCLLPPQFNLISDGLLESEENCIVTIPTSTGKTLLAELAIGYRLTGEGDISIFVTPYIALGRQVFETLYSHRPQGVDVHGYFGNFNSHIEKIDSSSSTIIVATPERLDAILRANDFYGRISTIVFDEAHGIENGTRGARLEALISRLRLQQARGHDFRIILLSAVLSNVEEMREWLGEEADHYQDTWRPTARRLAIWTNDGKLSWLYGGDPLRPSDKQAVSFIGRKTLAWPEQMRPVSTFAGMTAQRGSAFRNAAFLARYVRESVGGPVLAACYAKSTTRGLAAEIASGIPDKDYSSPTRDKLLAKIKSDYPHLKPLAAMIARGVAYHNASLPAPIKDLIEDAIKVRDLDYIAATTTLAEGVDLPFRSTIIFDWLIGFGEGQSPMSSLLFRNIAGRCGRAGEFTEGDTIIFDNVLGEARFTDERNRRKSQRTIFGDPPPLQSVIANDNLSAEDRQSVKAILSSQLMASIPENPATDHVENALSRSLYANFHGQNADWLLAELRAELLSDADGEPFAKAASPMWLTPLGQAANHTGFGPGTCRQMLSFLRTVEAEVAPAKLAAALLVEFGVCAEQTNHLLHEVALRRSSSRFFVKATDLEGLAQGWLDGASLTDLFLALPKAQQSKAAVPPARWAAGEMENEFVAGQYDKFVDLIEYAFAGFLPWLLRAMAALQDVAEAPTAYMWDQLSVRFETSRASGSAGLDQIFSEGISE